MALAMSRVRCISRSRGVPSSRASLRSDCSGQLVEGRSESLPGGLVGGDLVVAAAQVLDEGMAGGEYPQPGHGLDPAHGAQASFQLGVVGLDPVVGVPLDVVPRHRQHLLKEAG
jgi:hypothetical protein